MPALSTGSEVQPFGDQEGTIDGARAGGADETRAGLETEPRRRTGDYALTALQVPAADRTAATGVVQLPTPCLTDRRTRRSRRARWLGR